MENTSDISDIIQKMRDSLRFVEHRSEFDIYWDGNFLEDGIDVYYRKVMSIPRDNLSREDLISLENLENTYGSSARYLVELYRSEGNERTIICSDGRFSTAYKESSRVLALVKAHDAAKSFRIEDLQGEIEKELETTSRDIGIDPEKLNWEEWAFKRFGIKGFEPLK